MKIETVGKHGSGKSSAGSLLSEMLELPLVRLNQRNRKGGETKFSSLKVKAAARRVESVVRFPRSLALAGETFFRGDLKAVRSAALMSARLSTNMLALSSGIFDEGPRHSLATALSRADSVDIEEWAPRFTTLPYEPDCVLWIQCDVWVARRRYLNRATHGVVEASTSDEVILRYERYNAVMRHLLGPSAITVDSTHSSPAEVALRLKRKIDLFKTGHCS